MNADDPDFPPEPTAPLRPLVYHGRGAGANPDSRYHAHTHTRIDDGWGGAEAELPPLATTIAPDQARSVIARNDSPDVGFSASINPYRGCEHGCVYCFARPTHAYLGLSPGLDFETRLFFKADAAARLRAELAKPGYRCTPLALGINTDAYQPIERKMGVTRALLEVLAECRHPLSIVTKSALIERDLDLLAPMAQQGLAQVFFSITTLDNELARRLEPRAARPQRRLEAMQKLAAAGVPTGVMAAPVIPVLTDPELEKILAAAAAAGAHSAGYVVLRLPHELKELFRDWLATHASTQAAHVMARVQDLHGGKDYDATFGRRMRGTGPFADLIAQRFRLACKRLGLNRIAHDLRCDLFRPPRARDGQLDLF